MLRRWSGRRAKGDDGLALVVALMVTFLTFLISTAILAQAIHNVTQSGYGRSRLAAVNAAEAGLNWYVALANATVASGGTSKLTELTTAWSATTVGTSTTYSKTGDAATSPSKATYTIRVTYTLTSPCTSLVVGVTAPCTPPATGIALSISPPSPPVDFSVLYAYVLSTGRSGASQRTLESYVRLKPVRSGLQTGLVTNSTCLQKESGGGSAKVEIRGDLFVEFQPDGWPVRLGAPVCAPGNNIQVGPGDVLEFRAEGAARGSLTIKGADNCLYPDCAGLQVDSSAQFKADGDVWADGTVALGGSSGSPPIGGTCSGSKQCVLNNIKADIVTFGPSSFVGGEIIDCIDPCRPQSQFPVYEMKSASWPATGSWGSTAPSSCNGWQPLTVSNVSTDSRIVAAGGLAGWVSSRTCPSVLFIDPTDDHIDTDSAWPSAAAWTPACDINFSGLTLTLKSKVAIVSKCRFVFETQGARLSGSGSLMLISASDASGNGRTSGGSRCYDGSTTSSKWASYGIQDVTIRNQQSFLAPLYIYTPCVLRIESNQDTASPDPVQGQFAAKYLLVKNSVRLVQRNIALYINVNPGVVTAFSVDVRLVREIPTP